MPLQATKRAIEIWLTDELPNQLAESCAGCAHYHTHTEVDAGGYTICGGMTPRTVTTLECTATHFQQCPKLRQPLLELLELP